MAKYNIKYGNLYSGRERNTTMNVQKNSEHWNFSKKSDERDGYKVNMNTIPSRKYRTKTVLEYQAFNKKTGDYYIAQLNYNNKKH